MTWTLSRFRTGDVVQVRSKEEILATLDENGCLEGMPFMPEMLQFCGRSFHVAAVAHKTCDYVSKTTDRGRRLSSAVHLVGTRCDGSAHGGCEAECNLFWKDAWLELVGSRGDLDEVLATTSRGCTADALEASTRSPSLGVDEEARYSCQATRLYEATELLPWWDCRQYVFDVLTGNCSVGRVLRVTWLAILRWSVRHTPFGYRMLHAFSEWMHRQLTGRGSPSLRPAIALGAATPTGRLDLRPGELVRIKSKEEIEQTIDEHFRNRGLSFDPEEMAPFCGRVVRVHRSVTRIIEDSTGKMIFMKQPCIMLEGVVCQAEYAKCRLNCPRAIPSYWREIWLERVEAPARTTDQSVNEDGTMGSSARVATAAGESA